MMGGVIVLRATRKLRPQLGRVVPPGIGEVSTGLLGDWYATMLPWRPRQICLMVSETTLLPVLMPLAPAATLTARLPECVSGVLVAHGAPTWFVERELSAMAEVRLASSTSRSLTGSMTEFARLAGVARANDPAQGLVELSLWLSTVPCGPLYARHVSPDRELSALVVANAPTV